MIFNKQEGCNQHKTDTRRIKLYDERCGTSLDLMVAQSWMGVPKVWVDKEKMEKQ